jgi:hypothetical protein
LSLLPDDKKELLKNDFKEKLVDPVKIVMFTQEFECRYCSDTRKLAQELATLNDKITVEVYDFVADSAKAKEYGIDKIPALAIIGKKDYGVRIYGIPYGYELQTLIEAIINVSKGKTDLSDKTKQILTEVKLPVHIQVFVTLTCPQISHRKRHGKSRRHRNQRVPRLSHEIQRDRGTQNNYKRNSRVCRCIQRGPVCGARSVRCIPTFSAHTTNYN